MNEVWKDIKGYEGLYQVSNYGQVKSLDRLVGHRHGGKSMLKSRVIKPRVNRYGYHNICLCMKNKSRTFTAHYLVALAFIGERPSGLVIDHIDENKTNNHISNLRYITTRENTSRSKRGFTSSYIGVSWCKSKGRWHAQMVISKKNKHIGFFDLEIDASKAYQDELKKVKAGFYEKK